MDTSFTNPQIDHNTLPRVEAIQFLPKDGRYLAVMRWRCALGILLPLLVGVVVLFATQYDMLWLPMLALVGWFGVAVLLYSLSAVAFRNSGYALRQHDLVMRSQLLTAQQTVVPFATVQHVKVDEGLLMRAYGLASVSVFTASGGEQNLAVSGITAEEAHRIKHYILERIDEHATH